ncbi:MAG: hypothetical protein H0T66_00015 [Geodermatophilaceae bacterium]|nr:hypothetical protein [Geodermatophilaceae bacterium]
MIAGHPGPPARVRLLSGIICLQQVIAVRGSGATADELVTGLLDRLADDRGGQRLALVTVTRPAVTSAATSATPFTATPIAGRKPCSAPQSANANRNNIANRWRTTPACGSRAWRRRSCAVTTTPATNVQIIHRLPLHGSRRAT